MIARVLTVLVLFAAITGLVIFTGARTEPQDPTYTVVLDNAFGLIEGADVKVAGVRAGKIKSFDIDPTNYRAKVVIQIKKEGFGELRKDVFCETRPQSLIGEYFLDCLPGTSPTKIKPGGTIPVENTGSTVPVDLVTNIMRRPYRERLSIILGELGAGLTARGEDLNETIRRANPALREVDKVLRALAEQRTIIRDLVDDADAVVTALADKRTEVTRFVAEARDTSRATAERSEELRAQFQTFPEFLRELRPTMASLGRAVDAQRPALETLSAQAPLLKRFFDELGPFSEASRPATRTLAAAARTGRRAVKSATPRIPELAAFAKELPELATNAALTLEHLHNRDFAVEENKSSPGGKGFTGFEAILQYVFNQGQATNVYDRNSYMLKVSAFLDNLCANYTTPNQIQADPEGRRRCRAILGPNQLGIDQPDPTAPGAETATTTKKAKKTRRAKRTRSRGADKAPATGGTQAPAQRGSSQPTADPTATPGATPVPPSITETLEELLPGGILPGGAVPPLEQRGPLLDYLLGG